MPRTLRSTLFGLRRRMPVGSRGRGRRPAGVRPGIEGLESRHVMSASGLEGVDLPVGPGGFGGPADDGNPLVFASQPGEGPGSIFSTASTASAPTLTTGANWMSAIADDRFIGDFTIPGTHETMSLFDHPVLSDTAKCQTMTLAEQLAAGARLLDIRCRHVGNAFTIHHGMVFQQANFDDVLTTVAAFLRQNPSETVLLSVKQEYEPLNPQGTFSDVFLDYVSRYQDAGPNGSPLFYPLGGADGFSASPNSMPKLGTLGTPESCRGKIVLVNRFDPAVGGIVATGFPVNGSGTVDTGNGFSLIVQDAYKLEDMSESSKQAKLVAFEQARLAATNSVPGSAFTMNFASGYSDLIFGIPDGIAELSQFMNPQIIMQLRGDAQARPSAVQRSGGILVDYATPQLFEEIWRTATGPGRSILSRASVRPDITVGSEVGVLTTSVSSASTTARYELVAGPGDTGNTAFEIVGNRLKTTSSLMGFVGSTLQVRVRATDSSGIATETVLAIQVTEGLVRVGLVGNWVRLTLAPEGTAITNLATTYDAAAARLTITAATSGSLAMAAPVNGISVDAVADTITVDLRKITKFAGLSIIGGANTDSVTIGPGGVNLAAVGRGAAAQGLFIDTAAGASDSITINGRIMAKGAGGVSLATQGQGVTRGVLLQSNVVTPKGSQSFGGGVTLLNGVALQAGGDISFSSTIDGSGRLQLSAGRSITMAGDVGGSLPLQGITLTNASRVRVGGGLVLDGAGTAAGTSGFVVRANVHNVVFSPIAAARTISGFGGAGIRFAGGSTGSRIAGVTSMGNGVGLLVGPGVYSGTVVSDNSFSGNVGHGVALQSARDLRIGGRLTGAGNEIVSNGGFGVAATGPCTGSIVLGSELGDNALGQVENYLASSLAGNLLVQSATGLLLRLNDVGRAAYRAQKAGSYSFDVGVEAFVVSARSTGWLDTRTAALAVDASVGFMEPSAGVMNPAGMQRMMLGENHLATSLTPLSTLPGIEFAKSVQYVGNDSHGRHYRAVVGLSTFAGMIPLADLQTAPSIGRDGSPVPVDVWVNAQGNVSRIAAEFAGGAFAMSLRGQGAAGFVPGMPSAQAVGTTAANAGPGSAAATILVNQSPSLPGTSNGVSGVQVGSSTLAIPFGGGVAAPADWYFPTQVDGAINSQGVIWLQHAVGAAGGSVASLALDLARQTNSIVVAPSLPTTMNWWLTGSSAVQDVASLFVGARSALAASAAAAGYAGPAGDLTGTFVLAGHSAGGGFATAVAADYAAQNPASTDLVAVVMYDGVSGGAFDGSGSFATQVAELDSRSVPIYQLAAPAQLWNAYGATTDALVATNPGRFRGVVLTGGAHVDAMVGGSPADDIVVQRVTGESLPGNAAAARTLTAGWINDLYAGLAPQDAHYGFYAAANRPILLGPAAANPLPSPVANMWSAAEWRIGAELAAIGGLSGFQPGPAVSSGSNGLSGAVSPQASNGVTGVKTGTSSLAIPSGPRGDVTSADWYFPTQADGQVSANGVVWFQRGEHGDAAAFAALAAQIAGQTNSIVVAPAISSFEIPNRPGAFLGSAAMQEAVAGMMLGDRGALVVSATAAGYQGVLPEKILLAGQRLGGGFAADVAARTVDNGAAADLLGVVMVDGVAAADQFAASLAKLDSLGIPLYQIASPPQAANSWGRTTEQLTALHPDQFVGVQFDDASPVDAVITLATGWINDFYSGNGPTDPRSGIYANPNDGTFVANQPIVMGGTGITVLPAPPPVDINQYAGRWYEQGSVKQPTTMQLVNVTAVYTPQPDGTIAVENAGTSGPNGPAWTNTGYAIPVNAANTRLSVAFSGEPTRDEPGNYWILDYAPDYSWAIVSDPTGTSASILTRDQFPSEAEYEAIVARAYRLGVRGTITPTAHYPTT